MPENYQSLSMTFSA